MLVYNYDPATFEFLGVKEARKDPRDPSRYLLPANATFTPAGQAPEGFVQQFNPNSDSWSSVEDNRGDAVYRKSDAAKVTVDWLGEVGDDYTSDAPSSAEDTWDGTEWVPPAPTVGQIKAEAERRIVAFCPEWRQRNFLAMRMKLMPKTMSLPPTITPSEQDKLDLYDDVFDHINAIRAASDVLEGTLPIDYTDDSHWPTDPGLDLTDK